MPFTFRFRWIPFIAAASVVTIGIALGQWQMRRAAAKETIELKLSARETAPPVVLSSSIARADDIEYRRVFVRGEFLRDWPVYLDNRPYKGMAGFEVLMPLRIDGSDINVLIARGWMPRDLVDRTKLPPLMTPRGMVEIQGVAKRRAGHLLQLGHATNLQPGSIVQNLEVNQFAQASRLTMQPFIIEQTSNLQDGLIRDWPRPSLGIDTHYGYAFQWYALAAMASIFFVATGFRRGTQ